LNSQVVLLLTIADDDVTLHPIAIRIFLRRGWNGLSYSSTPDRSYPQGVDRPAYLKDRARKVRVFAAAVGHPEVSMSLYDYATELEARATSLERAGQPGGTG
jgi:hypothetical protein